MDITGKAGLVAAELTGAFSSLESAMNHWE